MDKATVYNTERSFETTMPAANITLNAEFSAIPIVKAPKKVVMSSAKNASKLSVTVKWKKTACTKYEVQIATNKKFKKGLKQKTVKSSKSSYTFKKLKKNKVY